MLSFLAVGNWADRQVQVRWTDSTRRIVPDVERLIDTAWQSASRRPGMKLFDGPMCRLESWQLSADCLRLVLSATSYKPFFGTNLSHPELAEQYGSGVMANPLGVSPALESCDGFLLLGKRNAAVAYYPNRVHPFSGSLEPRDGQDVFRAVRRELQEELALADTELSDLLCTGLVEDSALRHTELIFAARTNHTRPQIEAQVAAEEHGDSVAIPVNPDAIERALRDPALTPVATAALRLWGRIRFGDEWFHSCIGQRSRV